MDVKFKIDGTAEDVSPMKNKVLTHENLSMLTTYNEKFGNYVSRFHHSQNDPGGNVPLESGGFFQVKYDNNQLMKDGLAGGHTLEVLFTQKKLANATSPKDMKMFSAMEGGGTGFVMGTNNSKSRQFIFLPYIGSAGYRHTESSMVPTEDTWYHGVGVYDKLSGNTKIYVNGALKATVNNIAGSYSHPASAAVQWFGIGGDPNATVLQHTWIGDVAIARIYSGALSATDVTALYSKVTGIPTTLNTNIVIDGISYPSGLIVKEGDTYTVSGTGFQSGDKIRFTPISGVGTVYECSSTSVTTSNITINIPEGFVDGRYRLAVVRGANHYDLGFVKLQKAPNETKIICHRGYWNVSGSAEN